MKILHISLNCQYNEGWGYQENILPKMQVRLGHQVTLLVGCFAFSEDASGSMKIVDEGRYTNADGVDVIRLKKRQYFRLSPVDGIVRKFGFTYHKIDGILEELSPDVIFLHGLTQNITNKQIFDYVEKHKNECKLFGDAHIVPQNDTYNTTGKKILFKSIILPYIRKGYRHYTKFFYLTPESRDYISKKYKIKKEDMTFLPLGYDPSLCDWDNRSDIRRTVREKLGIPDDAVVLVHGGKITQVRKTPEVIKAFNKLKNEKIRLVIFGGIDNQMSSEVNSLLAVNPSVIYLGKLSQKEYYDLYLASDIGVFPGGQSVLWQEAIGCGLPLIVKKIQGLEYLDVGGNVLFIDDSSADSVCKGISQVLEDSAFVKMSDVASSEGRKVFSYERIAMIAAGL